MIFWKKKTPPVDMPPPPAEQTAVPVPAVPETPVENTSWLQRLGAGLSHSSQKLTQGIVAAVTKRPLDQEALDALEEALIMADLGPGLAARLVADFAKTRFGKQVSETEVKDALAAQIAMILNPVAQTGDWVARLLRPQGVTVILMVGVNGSGKTTTIGKIAQHLGTIGKKTVLAAGDTFRAAAVEQLQQWGQRTGATVIAKGLNTDAAAVAFEALEAAQRAQADVVLIDTAGRLHNKANLMEELAKIRRVIDKAVPGAPHAVILTLDATIGQNAITQVEEFNKIVPLSGLVVTKLDGSAKAGVVVALADRFKLPILAVGVGEGPQDLQAFMPDVFARALVGQNV